MLSLLVGTASCAAAESEAADGKMSFLPLPAMFSTPETGFGGGAILMAIGNLYPDRSEQLQDSYRLAGIYTVKRQSSFALQAEHYIPGNGLKLDADASFSRYPSTFYGIGGPWGGTEEDYTQEACLADATLGFAIAPALYLGPRVRWTRYSMQDRESGGFLDRGEIEGSGGANVLLLGPVLSYEGRDSPMAPTRGCFVELVSAYSPKSLGGSSSFSSSSIDLRAYAKPFADFGAVAAVKLYAAMAQGEVPFQELPKMGGDGMLRGYLEAKYQDKAVAIAQAELRLPVFWRFGLAVFGGVGFIGSDALDLSLDDPRFAGGLGFRFLVDKNSGTNLRMDLAWGESQPQLYFELGEAF
jgi:outer membrane protein assembly factor BamA